MSAPQSPDVRPSRPGAGTAVEPGPPAIDQALREAEDRYRQLVEHSPDGILVHVAGRFVLANPAAVRLFGASSPDDVVGRAVLDLVHPDCRDLVSDRTRLAASGHATPVTELTLLRMDGSPVDVEVTGAPVEFEGHPAVQILVRDLTERRSAAAALSAALARAEDAQRSLAARTETLRNSERLYRAIGESIDYGVWVCAPDGRNVYASESFLRLVGLTQEQCSNFGWGDVLHPEDAERTIEEWKRCVAAEGTWDIEHRFRGADGAWHPILARGVPVRDERGEILCWAGINLDIKRLKDAESALRESDRRKTEFLATLSHELRNPLAPIRYALGLLGRERADDSAPERVIERQVVHLVRLVDDLLDVTRIASNKVELRPERIQLGPVIRQAVEAGTPAIRSAGLALTVELAPDPIWLDGDRERLAQVFTNLLNNAARYTPKGGRISVTAHVEGDHAVVSVVDTGVGLAAGDLSRVFGMFTQVGEPGQGGLGIGLAIVKGIVELHGGAVEARSAGPGLGCEFLVRLPRVETTGVDPEPIHPRGEAARFRILVVDDNADSAEMLKLLLELRGHEVRAAYGGREALDALAECEFDVGLFDVGLPGISGHDLARRVREDPRLARMLLIAVTGWGQEEDRQLARAHGFDAHLTKPADPDDIERLMGGARAAR
jgi:PAS domain S-box-containing protein